MLRCLYPVVSERGASPWEVFLQVVAAIPEGWRIQGRRADRVTGVEFRGAGVQFIGGVATIVACRFVFPF